MDDNYKNCGKSAKSTISKFEINDQNPETCALQGF
jgi:hypothetical protein